MDTLEAGAPLLEGRYTLVRELGRGGTGRVWEARRRSDGRTVAVKCMPADAGGRAAADREAEVAVRVKHPALVQVVCTHDEGDWALVVMERCDGSLATQVKLDGPLAPAAAAARMVPVLDALQAAHAVGVVHRDVKPGNILVRPDGTVALSDWGMARALFGDAGGATTSAALIGTLPFLAPEVRKDVRRASPASDVYAAGITLAWLCLGEAPDDPFVADGAERLRRELGPIAAVVIRACAWAPEDRYASAAEMAAALQALAVQPVGGRDSGPVGAVRPVGGTRRPRWVLAGAAAALVAGVGLWGAGAQLAASPVAASPVAASPVAASPVAASPVAASPVVTPTAWPACTVAVRDFVSTHAPGPLETIAAAVGDLDADGALDVVFSNQEAESLTLWWGRAGGLPATHDELSVGRVSGRVAILDADGDGLSDLVVPHRDAASFTVHAGRGGRRFAPGRTVEQGPAPGNLDVAGPGWVVFDADRLLLTRATAAGAWPPHFVQGAASSDPPAAFVHDGQPWVAARDALGWSLRRLARRAEDAARVALPEAVANARTLVPWWGAHGPEAIGALVGDDLVRIDIDAAGAVRVCRAGAWPLWPSVLAAIADLDADGVPDVVATSTCSGCTSNQVFARGVR